MIKLETERLYLRPLEKKDLPDLCRLDGDPDVRAYFPEGTLEPAEVVKDLLRYQKAWQTQGFGMFGFFDKQTELLIGRGGFAKIPSGEVEFGYLLFKHYWGKGLATEAAKALLAWGSTVIPSDRIIGFARLDHQESRRILEKCGMHYFKNDFYYDREWAFYEYRLQPNQ